MPHTSTRIYVDTSVTPPLGIDPADVAAVLVRNTGDYGQLCGDVIWDGSLNNGNGGWRRCYAINKWAKYKPVRKANMWNTQGVANWWKADNGLCGIDADLSSQNFVFSVFSSFVNRMKAGFDSASQYYNNFLNWDYAPPRGMAVTSGPPADQHSTEPYRKLDFDGYIHDAVSPAGNVRGGVYDVIAPSAYDYTIMNYGIELALDPANLQVTDFGGFSVNDEPVLFEDCYIGVLLVNLNSGAWYGNWSAATMSKPIKDLNSGDNHIKIIGTPLSGTAVNTAVKALPFITTCRMTEDEFPEGINNSNIAQRESEPHPDTGAELTGAWLSAFGVEPVNVTLHRFGQYDISLDTEIEYASHYVTGDVYVGIGAAQSSAVSLGNIAFGICDWDDVQLYRNGSITQAELFDRVLEDNTVTWNNVTIPAGSTSVANTLELMSQSGNGLYLSDDVDTSKDWVLVGFPPSGASWNAIISVSPLNYPVE